MADRPFHRKRRVLRARLLTHAVGYWLDSPTLQRAHRCAVSQSWDNEISTIDNVVRLSNKLASSMCSSLPTLSQRSFPYFSLDWLDTIDKLGEHAENENFQPLCHSIRLALNSVITRLKQKSESSLIANDQTLNESIQLLTKSLAQLPRCYEGLNWLLTSCYVCLLLLTINSPVKKRRKLTSIHS